jgi:hypothetical protein
VRPRWKRAEDGVFGVGPASICEKMGHRVKDSVTEQGLHLLTPWAHVTVDLRVLRMNRTFYQ